MDATMTTGHTPGPLTIKGPSPGRRPGQAGMDDGGDYAILDDKGRIIGEAIHMVFHDDFRPAQANAQLWATAPAMLEELKAIYEELDDRYDGAPDSTERWMASYLFKLRAVIAKAEEVQP